MNPATPQPQKTDSGFTLVELLVVVAILIVLAALAFKGASQAIQSARMSKNMAVLRDLGNVINTYATEYGHFPPGEDENYEGGPLNKDGGKVEGRGPDYVNAYREMWKTNETWLSPVLNVELSPSGDQRQPTHFTGHPVLFYDSADQEGPVSAQVVTRPGETILLCDGIPMDPTQANNPRAIKDAAITMSQWYDFRDHEEIKRDDPIPTGPGGQPHRSGPDFRNKDKCHVLFVDGAVRALAEDDFKVKHVTLSY